MKKVSDVFKSIRFAKGEPRGKEHSSTDDEEHYTVGEKEFDQQLQHAKKRAMQEEVEQLDELSPETLQNYKDKAKKSADELTAKGEHGKSLKRWTGHMKATGKQIDKTTANIRKALNREETEQIDEIIKQDVQQDAETMDKVSFLKKHGVTKSKAKELAQEDIEHLEEKNVPTSPEKWAQAKAQAKAKFDVYPSAYANGWAAKKYKEMGGGWKSMSEAKEEPPFDPDPPKKNPVAKAGKHGQGYSTARHLARMAMQRQAQKYKKPVKEESELSNKAKIIKKVKKESGDKFQAEPVLSNTITKNN